MNRRRFTFWLGFGLFTVGDKLRLGGLDELAAALMAPDPLTAAGPTVPPAVHWRAAENERWRWFERESLVDGKWRLSGITTPLNKLTGEKYAERTGYLDESLVPTEVREAKRGENPELDAREREHEAAVLAQLGKHEPSEKRAARHGRPPSKWLRSLRADELRIWLKTIDVPEATVEGMTFWTHLTRDHSFDPEKIAGLTEAEQAKLHAAAHYGY